MGFTKDAIVVTATVDLSVNKYRNRADNVTFTAGDFNERNQRMVLIGQFYLFVAAVFFFKKHVG